ncbi:MAG: beta-ketoacyl synthase N-terminal-like domain-containing protein, partial [Steroidobacteraceae bacterium]
PQREETSPPASAASRGPAADGSRGASEADFAVIGLSGRYANADNVTEFWRNLCAGENCIREIPPERWDWRAYFSPQRGRAGSIYSKWGGFLREIDTFDPLFFHLSPLDAERMDPQERLFLEEAYASIEDAGYTPGTLTPTRRVGVFVGVMNGTYSRKPTYWSIANRVSHVMDFQGPSLVVDTACSSSLTAIHLALESLRSGGCECAIAGGVNLIVDPSQYLSLSAQGMLSAGDSCRAFGDMADGFVDGEGVGAIVIKPLAAAAAADDHIYGVLKSSAINAGGRTHGYTVPNPQAQATVVADAIQRAGVPARAISCIEAHGTGTALGDPIEILGLSKAFGRCTSDVQFCALGSVKSNIGHCESAAGIAGLTKLLLQLEHRMLVPSLHAEVANPRINFARTPFVLQRTCCEWRRPLVEVNGERVEYPRTAGLSSFGAGGANAHLIVQEHVGRAVVAQRAGRAAIPPFMFVLSGRDPTSLRERGRRLRGALASGRFGDADLPRIAFTLQTGRDAMSQRLGFTASSLAEVQARLDEFLATDGAAAAAGPGLHVGRVRSANGSADAEATKLADGVTIRD